MTWFEKITGFRELAYDDTQAKLSVQDGRLCSENSAERFGVGRLETPSLQELRGRVGSTGASRGRAGVGCIEGDARALHSDPQNGGALFQVASQFNLLEMVGPNVTPEDGVTRYESDRTQGPACAIAAGAGTIYRNYLIPLEGGRGQRIGRQIDCLADLGAAMGNGNSSLWSMQNGYALPSERGLIQIDEELAAASEEKLDELRGLLRIGLHWDVQVTEAVVRQLVSQAYSSALPISYTRIAPAKWRRFACLVLEATYEATLLAAVLNARRGESKRVLLTQVGGGAFGNRPEWVASAIRRAVGLVRNEDLDVQIVCYRTIPDNLRELATTFSGTP